MTMKNKPSKLSLKVISTLLFAMLSGCSEGSGEINSTPESRTWHRFDYNLNIKIDYGMRLPAVGSDGKISTLMFARSGSGARVGLGILFNTDSCQSGDFQGRSLWINFAEVPVSHQCIGNYSLLYPKFQDDKQYLRNQFLDKQVVWVSTKNSDKIEDGFIFDTTNYRDTFWKFYEETKGL